MTHDPETKEKAIQMFKDGLKPQEISEELGVRKPTIYTWTKGVTVEKQPTKIESKFNLEAALENLTEEELFTIVNSDALKWKSADIKVWRKRINSILQERERLDAEKQQGKSNWALMYDIWNRKREERLGRRPILPKPSEESTEETEVETIAPFWESDEDDDEEE